MFIQKRKRKSGQAGAAAGTTTGAKDPKPTTKRTYLESSRGTDGARTKPTTKKEPKKTSSQR